MTRTMNTPAFPATCPGRLILRYSVPGNARGGARSRVPRLQSMEREV